MALNEALAFPAPRRAPGDAAAVLLVTLVFAALQAAQGLPNLLTLAGDNDSLLRLVEVRDWLGGQGWFNLHQLRMGPEGGFVMHWSRLVDAPLGALVLLGSLLGGSRAAGELFAQVAWPALMFAGCLLALVRIAKHLWGEAALLPAVVLGGAALHFPGIFALGNIDHHGFQLLLLLCVTGLLLRAGQVGAGQALGEAAKPAAAAGVCAALMLGVGAETAPYVAAAGLFVAARFGLGASPRGEAIGFGLGFAAAAFLVFFGTVPPASWTQPACDAFSAPQGLLAVAGGLGLAGIAVAGPLPRAGRLSLLVLLGAACAGLAVALFPQCLGDPYASVDPRLRTFWLDGVAEAQPFLNMVRERTPMAFGFYATPALGGALLAWHLLRGGERRPVLLPGLMLLTGIAISLWQVRGAFFALPLAVPFLAGFVVQMRGRAEAGGGSATALSVLAWLVCLPIVWAASASLLVPMTEQEAADFAEPARGDVPCKTALTLAQLAALPPAKVLAISNLGSLILANTHHAVLAGPYHRNIAGNLAALDAWMADPAAARGLLASEGIGLVAFCAGNAETQALATAAPRGLIGELEAGRVPSWLTPVPETAGAPLRLFRIDGQAQAAK